MAARDLEPIPAQLGHLAGGELQSVIDAARDRRDVRTETVEPNDDQVRVFRDDAGNVRILSGLEWFRDRPRRALGVHKPADVTSLIALVNDLADPQATTIWVHLLSGRVEAVFDDHASDTVRRPGHGEHRAVLELQPTPEWTRWTRHNRQLLTQSDFAELVEDGIPDIAEPSGAELLEIVSTLTGRTEVNWAGGTRLQDGTVQLKYDEQQTASAGRRGDLEIPSSFTLMLAPFYGEQREPITARLRYRLGGGNLKLGFVLDRPEEVTQRVLLRVRERLAEQFPRTYVGEPRG